MRKAALILLMCVTSLVAMAEGWEYAPSKAGIQSEHYRLHGYGHQPTALSFILVHNDKGENVVLCILEGECTIHDFVEGQKYVCISFGDFVQHKYEIKEITYKDEQFRAFLVGNADEIIERLKECENFSIIVPLYNYGKHTFYFSAVGYPLYWQY